MKRRFKIISGGQTGVDRAALEWALVHDVPHGGWCPRGRKAEDGRIPAEFNLTEARTSDYAVRTRWNIRDSDGTVIFSAGLELNGGSWLTWELAQLQGKPRLHLQRSQCVAKAVRRLGRFIEQYGIVTLNVAGPRSSEEPETPFLYVSCCRAP